MASIGHVAVGMAAARGHRTAPVKTASRIASMTFWSALSLFPDIDVAGFHFGVRYADVWGHRGATHSLVFAVGVGLIIGALARRGRVRTAALAGLVVASHGILDTMTDGGLGVALLWPFDPTRYFAPWQPIPVAPIGRAYFSSAGLHVALAELVLFFPAAIYALWPRARRVDRSPMSCSPDARWFQ